MMPSLMATKVQAWRKSDMLGFQKMPAEHEGIAAKRRDVGVQIECPFRLDGNTETQFAQRRQQEVPATAELGAPLLEYFKCLRLKSGKRGMLRHAWCADVEVLRQFFQIDHGVLRCNQPTEAPARHAEIL